MPLRRAVFVVLVVLSAVAAAQPDSGGETLAQVRVEGTTSYADIVRVVLEARAGTPVTEIDLEAERNRVYSLGTFSEVSVSLEEETAGPVLVVTVEENPLIAEVIFDGVEAVPPATLRSALEREHLLASGRVFNTTRAEEALGTVQRIYRQRGFPFLVPVSLEVQEVETEAGGEGIRVAFEVDEAAPVDEVIVEESTVLEAEPLRRLFQPLVSTGEFDFELYRQALERVEERYREQGFRFSGVDVSRSRLQQGVLEVALHEARIAAIDTGAIDVDPAELSLEVGDLFNYDLILEDVRRLARGRRGDVRMVPSLTSDGDVRVDFELGPPETAGPVDEIEFEGNSVVSDEELREVLALEVGDTFTSTLAQEDFERIVRLYQDGGWVVQPQPDFSYDDGTYIQRITEVKVAGHDVTFEGEQKTEEFVITRYMPEVGTVVNQNEIRSGLRQIARLGAVEPVNVRFVPTDEPSEVVLNVIVREMRTGLFTPSAQYATDSGLSASLSFSEANFLGRAHSVGAEVNLQTSDIGLMLGGAVRYSIPWLYIDAYDFQDVPTSVSASLFSLVDTNQLLTADGSTRVTYPGGLADDETNRVLVGEYAQRDTGLSFSVGRPVADFTTLRFSARASIAEYKLEPPEVECTFDAGGDIENAGRCALPESEAATYLPQGGLSSFISTAVTYDDRDNPEFPRSGISATALAGLGVGTDYRSPVTGMQQSYAYQQLEFGVKTYVLLADIAPEEISDRNHVLAFRLNAGHQFGTDYPSSKRFQVGKSVNEATAIRGYGVGDFDLSRSYATAAAEYRYDFGLDTVATQTVIGIVFVDVGYASSVPGFPEYGAPLFAGAGVGVQVNLGFGGVLLPALRFDYGFSERNPRGEFRFRVGPVF